MEGKFGGGKIWQIHCKNIFGRRQLGEFQILRPENLCSVSYQVYMCKMSSVANASKTSHERLNINTVAMK